MTAPAFAPPVAWWERKTDADIVIVGVGIAGLSFSLRLPDSLRIVIVTKGPLGASNAWYAQDGIAAAVGPDDDPEGHLHDTIAAGAGLTDIDAARPWRSAVPLQCVGSSDRAQTSIFTDTFSPLDTKSRTRVDAFSIAAIRCSERSAPVTITPTAMPANSGR